MARRFYVPRALNVPALSLDGAEGHHLLHVLRTGPGQEVVLFDGQGTEAVARVESTSQGTAQLTILEVRTAQTETAIPLVLATAVPKGDRFGWLVEKATELGVARLVPLKTQRSIVDPGAGKLEKMRQAVVAASKQCGRSRLMEIDAPTGWRDFVDREFSLGEVYIADPSGDADLIPGERGAAGARVRPVVLAIGPEGGFTDAELELACEKGARLVSLGPRILRIETAALAMAAIFAQTK